MMLIFPGLVISFVLLIASYYYYQNKQENMGGKISVAKAFWLGYALFNYFIFTVFLYFFLENQIFQSVLFLIICVFYFRALFQGFLMFVTRNWVPNYGMMYNIVCIIIIFSALIKLYLSFGSLKEEGLVLTSLFLFKLILILFTDTIYAYKFKQLIGNNTKGRKAIWYASDERKFEKINRLTIRNNIIFSFISITLIILMILYDKP
ncbi:hypothetical protein JKA74_10645 [Marivirga sp. S37H4]|uniref:Uncharacterized protein n=1 Tax=Marivirga aurantiaca TaxID=2802615 RepID=A0A935C8A1_9BACT|nr:hypothetical protein [Marivirga aurantiaca]MBK6265496.1 hypothetical protein [Marivirga aurantiaca]